MSGTGGVRPVGYAATAAGFLDEAAADGDGRDLAVRELAALQGVGYALLAVCDQLADVTDGAADCATHLSGIAGAVGGLSRPSAAGRVRGALASLGQLWPGGLR
jgi:hypothetical protein